jgi:hypothetical protein
VKRWLATFALSALIASQAVAQSVNAPPSGQSDTVSAKLRFRLVQDPEFDSTPVHQSGVIAQTRLSDDATLSVGMLRVAPRQPGTGEWRNLPPSVRSKKAAVKFTLKF